MVNVLEQFYAIAQILFFFNIIFSYFTVVILNFYNVLKSIQVYSLKPAVLFNIFMRTTQCYFFYYLYIIGYTPN